MTDLDLCRNDDWPVAHHVLATHRRIQRPGIVAPREMDRRISVLHLTKAL